MCRDLIRYMQYIAYAKKKKKMQMQIFVYRHGVLPNPQPIDFKQVFSWGGVFYQVTLLTKQVLVNYFLGYFEVESKRKWC